MLRAPDFVGGGGGGGGGGSRSSAAGDSGGSGWGGWFGRLPTGAGPGSGAPVAAVSSAMTASASAPGADASGAADAAAGRDGATAALPFDAHELGMQLSVGSIAGFTAGYAIKKAGKGAALLVGGAFITVQLLRYYGYIDTVHWERMNAQLVRTLDADGDGRITTADLKVHFNRLVDVLGFELPAGAAFGAAFFLGLRYG